MARRSGRSVRVALVRMHAFQMGKHYLAVKGVPMLDASVFDDSIRDSFLVFRGELTSASRARLLIAHL